MAFDLIAAHDAQVQRHLAVGAAVLERKHLPALAAIEHDGFACETAAERPARFQLIAPGDGIPVIRMRADATQIERVGRIRRPHRDEY
jgi:hypothetical protein